MQQRCRRWIAYALVALGACGTDDDRPDVSIAAEAISANDCGKNGSTPWPIDPDDPEGKLWREAIPDGAPPVGYSPPAVQRAGRIEGEAGASMGTATYSARCSSSCGAA